MAGYLFPTYHCETHFYATSPSEQEEHSFANVCVLLFKHFNFTMNDFCVY